MLNTLYALPNLIVSQITPLINFNKLQFPASPAHGPLLSPGHDGSMRLLTTHICQAAMSIST